MRLWLIGAYWTAVLAVFLALMSVAGSGPWAFMVLWWIPLFIVPAAAVILHFILFQRRTARTLD